MSGPVVAVPEELPEIWAAAAREAGCEVVVVPEDEDALPATVRERAVALFAEELPLPRIERLLAALPSLRWMHLTSAGINRFDIAALAARKIVVTNSSGCYDIPIAEHVLACLLAHARRFPLLASQQRRGEWNKAVEPDTLAHSTVGIVGLGSIGREVARLAKAFRCRVEATRRRVKGRRPDHVDRLHAPDRLPALLKAADHVVVTLPLTDATRGLIGAEELALLRPGASLVNVGRGPVVDERALLEGLEQGRPAAAWLDVFETEPLPGDHPFWSHERVVVTPHVSWKAPQFERWALDLWRKNCERFARAEGETSGAKLINVRDLRAGY